tara:strand:+ start:186 stop:659 length:474 start_codon:yes stop_codon:yes gene_type:complete
MIFKKHSSKKAMTLVEVMLAVGIFVFAIFSILVLVNQTLNTVKAIQRQTPDLGALAGRTLLELPVPEGELEIGLTDPIDPDFGKNMGADRPIYPNAWWKRDLIPLDETNGLYQASVIVEDEIKRENTNSPSIFIEYELRFLMFRPDLAKALLGDGSN